LIIKVLLFYTVMKKVILNLLTKQLEKSWLIKNQIKFGQILTQQSIIITKNFSNVLYFHSSLNWLVLQIKFMLFPKLLFWFLSSCLILVDIIACCLVLCVNTKYIIDNQTVISYKWLKVLYIIAIILVFLHLLLELQCFEVRSISVQASNNM
jgi:hypothetical protein